jgi:NAD(P)-dependent dehydrogenase (short-subunit alcohol dehydrogenase family)
MSKQLIVLITGANRGIGLALTQAYLERGDRVVATCRHPAKAAELHKLKETYRDDLLILRFDVNLGRAAANAAEDIAEHMTRVDVLINNAGINPGRMSEGLENLEFALVRDAFETNALGPIRTTRAMLPLLRKSAHPRVINISSGAGSISKKAGDTYNYAYAVSKAALNMLTRIMGGEFKAQAITIVALTPGWVRTEMGGADAELDAAEVAKEIATTIDGLTIEQSSQWLDRRGAPSEYAW